MKLTLEQTGTPMGTPNAHTIRVREIEIEFKEWLHPQMGVVPVDPKTPLILKAVIREKV